MNGRILAALVVLVIPAALIGVTVYLFSSNPLSIMALVGLMAVGGLYMVTYLHESHG